MNWIIKHLVHILYCAIGIDAFLLLWEFFNKNITDPTFFVIAIIQLLSMVIICFVAFIIDTLRLDEMID